MQTGTPSTETLQVHSKSAHVTLNLQVFLFSIYVQYSPDLARPVCISLHLYTCYTCVIRFVSVGPELSRFYTGLPTPYMFVQSFSVRPSCVLTRVSPADCHPQVSVFLSEDFTCVKVLNCCRFNLDSVFMM